MYIYIYIERESPYIWEPSWPKHILYRYMAEGLLKGSWDLVTRVIVITEVTILITNDKL